MQVTFSFAGEITQVLDAIPWVRCASGNVLKEFTDSDEFGDTGNSDESGGSEKSDYSGDSC